MADSLQFDEPSLIARLAKLPNELRVAFAALCAERQLPNYIRFSATSDLGNPNVLKEALGVDLERISRDARSAMPSLNQSWNDAWALIPNGSEDTEEETAYAMTPRLQSHTPSRFGWPVILRRPRGRHGGRTNPLITSF